MELLSPDHVCLLSAALCATLGGVFDIATRRIPNWLTASLLVYGLLLHFSLSGWKAMGLAAVAGLIGGAIFFIFFAMGGMGAGDIKLMAAISSIAGLHNLAELFVATVLMGGLFAVVLAFSRGRMRRTLANVGVLIAHHGAFGLLPHPELNVHRAGTLRLPYGTAIAAGCWITLLAPSLLAVR